MKLWNNSKQIGTYVMYWCGHLKVDFGSGSAKSNAFKTLSWTSKLLYLMISFLWSILAFPVVVLVASTSPEAERTFVLWLIRKLILLGYFMIFVLVVPNANVFEWFIWWIRNNNVNVLERDYWTHYCGTASVLIIFKIYYI